MFRSACALSMLTLVCLFAPGPRAASADSAPPIPGDKPFAAAPGLTVTAVALTPGGAQVRTYRSGDTVVPWQKGQPVYRNDVFRLKAFLDTPGARPPAPTLRLDNRARPANPDDPYTWDIDTHQLGLGNHMVIVSAPTGGRKSRRVDVSGSFLVVAAPETPAPTPYPPSPEPEPLPLPPPPSTEDEPLPPTAWQGKDGAPNARVVLRVADNDGAYNPKAKIPHPLIISDTPTYLEVLPADPGIKEFVFRLFRNGRFVYESGALSHYACGPANPLTATTLINLYRNRTPNAPADPNQPVPGLNDGALKLYVWGIKDGRLGAPAVAYLQVRPTR